jgi:hypothetical protein
LFRAAELVRRPRGRRFAIVPGPEEQDRHVLGPFAGTGSRLVILNSIEKYAALLARQCDAHAGPEIDF